MLPVSSTAKNVAVSGERIVPPMVAHMPSSAQKPGLAGVRMCTIAAPRPPPMISSGASTPPDVPEPSATAQIAVFTASSSSASAATVCPCNICAML